MPLTDKERNELHAIAMNVREGDLSKVILSKEYRMGHRDARHAIAEAIMAYGKEQPADAKE